MSPMSETTTVLFDGGDCPNEAAASIDAVRANKMILMGRLSIEWPMRRIGPSLNIESPREARQLDLGPTGAGARYLVRDQPGAGLRQLRGLEVFDRKLAQAL